MSDSDFDEAEDLSPDNDSGCIFLDSDWQTLE